MIKIALIFDNFGPYHIARAKALNDLCDLVAIEAHKISDEYDWLPTAELSFRRVSLQFEATDSIETSLLLRKTLDAERPDVIFIPGWSSPVALEALAWARKTGTPGIAMSDSQFIDFPRNALSEWLKRKIVGRYSGAFVAGSPHLDYACKLGVSKVAIRLGYDVVDNAHFANGAAEARNDPTKYRNALNLPERYFLVSARFVEKKNLILLLSSFFRYRQASKSTEVWDLVLMGDGPIRPKLLKLISESGLQSAVHLLGFRQYEETPIVLGLAGALILPSTSEQWGLVVNESMAAGLPVLVSNRCGSATDLVVEGVTGFTFDPEDEDALSKLMLIFSALRDEERTLMGKSSQKKIAEFSPETFAENAMEIAHQVLQHDHRPHLDSWWIRLLAYARGRQ